jgi:hypothetical protein
MFRIQWASGPMPDSNHIYFAVFEFKSRLVSGWVS